LAIALDHIDHNELLAALRRHMAAGNVRLHVKHLARLLGLRHEYSVRVALESDEFGAFVARDAALASVVEEYRARRKGTLRTPACRSGGLRGSIDEVCRANAVGVEPPEDFNGSLGIDPLGPTRAQPGTDAKILVLADRYRRRVALHHPDDARRSVVGHAGLPPGDDEIPVAPKAEHGGKLSRTRRRSAA
jgi:hypothetical protein